MTFVVDASIAVPWLFERESSQRSEAALSSGERLIAPDLVIAEITNAAWRLVTNLVAFIPIHFAVSPPSITNSAPVTKADSSESR